MDYRSVLAGGIHRSAELATTRYPEVTRLYPVKFWWFAKNGYEPHVWQAVFHGAANEDETLKRFRHLVAGRRGGKTLSAAWETLFYALHPSEFHRDAHGIDSDRPLWIWILAKDYKLGFPSLVTMLDIMNQAGLIKGRDYNYNKTERLIEFLGSGTVMQFKTADDPQSLRGAGLDILWIDEAAFIDSPDAWHVVRPSLSDKLGLVITTTTPHGKNWFYEEFFTGKALENTRNFRVEYTSIDNPYFSREEWEEAREYFHPIMFRQEFMASFDAFTGIALQGDWLKYWVEGNPDIQTGDISLKPYLDKESGRYKMRIFLGIDPAISTADDADDFAMAVIGLTEDNTALLLDYWKGHIPFPEQLDKIREWHQQWRPEMIGVESNAYQHALAQMAWRLEGLPPIVPVFSAGKKNERILAMAPLFKVGRVRVSKRHFDFVDQWVNFNPAKKNQHDDLLDAVEIALGVAGILLPRSPYQAQVDRPRTIDEEATLRIRQMKNRKRVAYDPELGDQA